MEASGLRLNVPRFFTLWVLSGCGSLYLFPFYLQKEVCLMMARAALIYEYKNVIGHHFIAILF